MGLQPDDAIAIEDSQVGVRAATAAGLLCLAVPSEITAGSDFGAAHRVFGNLREAADWLKDQLGESNTA
jgi:beta-phosphoglucomutase-like phosphatase (HAD superfamily)